MAQQSIAIYRGETIKVTWTLEPLTDITGWTFLMTVSKQANSSAKVFQATPTVVSGAAGTFAVDLLSATTALLPPGAYYWDVWRNDAGQERLLAFGVLSVAANARFPA